MSLVNDWLFKPDHLRLPFLLTNPKQFQDFCGYCMVNIVVLINQSKSYPPKLPQGYVTSFWNFWVFKLISGLLNVSFRSYQLQQDRIHKIASYWVESRKNKKFLTVQFGILRYILLWGCFHRVSKKRLPTVKSDVF